MSSYNLVATRNTGEIIRERTGLKVTLMQSEPMGGDQQIGALVASGIVKGVIFLRDPMTSQPHEPDVSALLRLCDVYNVPLATNAGTAEAVLHFMFEHSDDLSEKQMEARLNNELPLVRER
jgi:methylglyoxal synthase